MSGRIVWRDRVFIDDHEIPGIIEIVSHDEWQGTRRLTIKFCPPTESLPEWTEIYPRGITTARSWQWQFDGTPICTVETRIAEVESTVDDEGRRIYRLTTGLSPTTPRLRWQKSQPTLVEAEKRAEELLRQYLTPDQWATWQEHRWFDVVVDGWTYRIRRNQKVMRFDQDGHLEAEYCIQPTEALPDADVALSQYLSVTLDTKRFLETANRWFGRDDIYFDQPDTNYDEWERDDED